MQQLTAIAAMVGMLALLGTLARKFAEGGEFSSGGIEAAGKQRVMLVSEREPEGDDRGLIPTTSCEPNKTSASGALKAAKRPWEMFNIFTHALAIVDTTLNPAGTAATCTSCTHTVQYHVTLPNAVQPHKQQRNNTDRQIGRASAMLTCTYSGASVAASATAAAGPAAVALRADEAGEPRSDCSSRSERGVLGLLEEYLAPMGLLPGAPWSVDASLAMLGAFAARSSEVPIAEARIFNTGRVLCFQTARSCFWYLCTIKHLLTREHLHTLCRSSIDSPSVEEVRHSSIIG